MRSHPWIKRALMAVGLSLALAVTTPAEATVAVQLDRAQLVEMSDLVVRATVVGATSRWNEERTQIITLTRLVVTQYVKGDGPTELVVRQFGGEVDGLVSTVAGDAHLEAGTDVVLCLRRGAGVVYLTAMAQSAWYVGAPAPGVAPEVHRDLSGLTLARMQSGRVQIIEHPTADARESLPQLLTSLGSLARARR
jgi:hypothetical protein